jgi:hypothetical protein
VSYTAATKALTSKQSSASYRFLITFTSLADKHQGKKMYMGYTDSYGSLPIAKLIFGGTIPVV